MKTKKKRGGVFKFITRTYKKVIEKKNEKQKQLSHTILTSILRKIKGSNQSIPNNKNMFKIIIKCIEDNLLFDLKNNDTPSTLENATRNAKLLAPYIGKNIIKIQEIITQQKTNELGDMDSTVTHLKTKNQEQINDIYIQLQNKENLNIQYFLLWFVNLLKVIDHYFQDEFNPEHASSLSSHDIQPIVVALILDSNGPSIKNQTENQEPEPDKKEQPSSSQDKEAAKKVEEMINRMKEEETITNDIVSAANQLNAQTTLKEETLTLEQMAQFLEKLNKNDIITDLYPRTSFIESLKIMTKLLKKPKQTKGKGKGGGFLFRDKGWFFQSMYMSNDNNTCNQKMLPIWWELHYLDLIGWHIFSIEVCGPIALIFVFFDILALLRCIECRRRRKFEYEPLNSLLRTFYDDNEFYEDMRGSRGFYI